MTKPPATPAMPPLILGVLALVSALEPLSINMYLSGLPRLAGDLDVTQAGAQLTLTFFLLGMSLGQLVMGTLSDAVGRRGLFVGGVIVTVVASVVAAVAPTAPVLFLARFLMGLAAGTAVVLARAVAGDLVRGQELARVFSLLMLLGGVAPVIGPVVGGFIVDTAGWRGVFWVLAGLNAIMMVAVIAAIPETLPRASRTGGGVGQLLRAIGALLRDRAYLGFTLGYIFSFSTMFTYVAASPFLLQEDFGFTPVQYSIIFAVNTTGMFLTSLVNARLVRRVGPLPLARVGNLLMVAAVAYLLVASFLGAGRWAILAGLFVTVSSMGLNFGNTSALAISRAGTLTGSASAFMGAGQFLVAGLLAPTVAWVVAQGLNQAQGMAIVMGIVALAAAAGVWGGGAALEREGASA
ncbi:multidrug effflux MFS transporter [Corynebacterium guangdongense]|uniref:DHA1 family bicyclomycin/chloramphenicol resistance-like MFS transporter n=1 Tax=Corynebacterium guangdongense TaxID=1783348 RepID=A0ABU1ZVL2_9CORY|nr:multidrug effflux MFS transporter [Corynebacterium guangdongense]MDR7328971.1 DHA1 family bicyclomycin/chloramphenicol resistance-like MFS transporter [Corynebacterium guangdongense]WJZ17544.1 Bicyclomycin resistance protein [Corynebacterium guangdongense]